MSHATHANQAQNAPQSAPFAQRILAREDLDALIAVLQERGYTVIGPSRRDGAIVLDELHSGRELPIGWRDIQAPGSYRLERRDDAAVFGHVLGPHSYKRQLHVPRERLFQLRRKDKSFEPVVVEDSPARPLALLGARACDIAAIAIQDRVLMAELPDPRYAARRAQTLIIAVSCNEPGGNCFCSSMGGDPAPSSGFDLSLTELLPTNGEPHRFVVEVGSEAGAALLQAVPTQPAGAGDITACDRLAAGARASMGKQLDTDHLKELLYAAAEHPRFEHAAARCLSCTSCTLVCPTCFCSRIDDITSLDGQTAERVRSWDSCFSLDYSYMHGGPARSSVAARYRHFLTHKLASWIDQFGSSGCVGCGRCISWCPAGIDITEEAAAIRAQPMPAQDNRA